MELFETFFPFLGRFLPKMAPMGAPMECEPIRGVSHTVIVNHWDALPRTGRLALPFSAALFAVYRSSECFHATLGK